LNAHRVRRSVCVQQLEVIVVPLEGVGGPLALEARTEGVLAATGATAAGPREQGLLVGAGTSTRGACTVGPAYKSRKHCYWVHVSGTASRDVALDRDQSIALVLFTATCNTELSSQTRVALALFTELSTQRQPKF